MIRFGKWWTAARYYLRFVSYYPICTSPGKDSSWSASLTWFHFNAVVIWMLILEIIFSEKAKYKTALSHRWYLWLLAMRRDYNFSGQMGFFISVYVKHLFTFVILKGHMVPSSAWNLVSSSSGHQCWLHHSLNGCGHISQSAPPWWGAVTQGAHVSAKAVMVNDNSKMVIYLGSAVICFQMNWRSECQQW